MKLCKAHKQNKESEDINCSLFGIGLGRTGTRSVTSALRLLGIKAIHGNGLCPECEKDSIQKYVNGMLNFHIYTQCEYAAGVSTIHWKQLAESLPDARFILTIRPLDKWIRSNLRRKRSHRLRMQQSIRFPLSWNTLFRLKMFGMVNFDLDIWTEAYRSHNKAVIKYFENTNRLLVLNIFEETSKESWNKLGVFIQKDTPDVGFPHNKKGTKL